MDEHAIRHLQTRSLEERRASGQVYTPPHLVAFVLARGGYPGESGPPPTLLDPACGCGVFLEHAVSLLAARLASAGIDPTSPGGRHTLAEHVSRSLYGVDVDEEACALARKALRAAVSAATSSLLPADAFAENIVVADFLLSPQVGALAPARAGGFDLVVGNPPYVSATRLENSYKAELRAGLKTARGRLDLYTLFVERALALLRAGGRVAFITPDKFLVSQSAKSLRSLVVREGAVRSIARFPSHKTFADAATVPCVTVLERRGTKAGNDSDVDVLECAEKPDRKGNVQVIGRWRVPARTLTAAGWGLAPPHLGELERKLSDGRRTLESVSSRVSAGLATGRDALYVLPADEAAEFEEALLRPAVRGRDLTPHHIVDSGLRILVPYTYETDGRPALCDLSQYPNAFGHLTRHRDALERRHCVRTWRKAWYDLHDPVPFDLATKTKILVPDVSYGSRFAVDEGRYVPLHSVYYIIPRDVDPHFLAALLNSRPLEFLIRLRAPKVKDGFSRFRKQFLTGLPVPHVGGRASAAIADAGHSGANRRVDELVCDAFGITGRDLRIILDFLGAAG